MKNTKNIQVVPYDPNWSQIFASEATLIKQGLGDNCLEIHHIGSTSVPGLASKPIIDIIVVMKESCSSSAISPLVEMGYKSKGEYGIPMRLYFNDKDLSDPFHIHLYAQHHPEIELNLCFRDYLRSHPQTREDYALLKTTLLKDESSFIKQKSGFTNYTLRKGDFIHKTLREAGFNRVRIIKCNVEKEMEAAKYFRQYYFFDPAGVDDPNINTFDSQEHAHLVLYQGVEIIGYAHIQFWPSHRGAIRIMVIDENKRNQNVGSKFLVLLEKWLKNLGIISIHAESRPSSLSFYLKNNYSEMAFNDPENHGTAPPDIAVGKML